MKKQLGRGLWLTMAFMVGLVGIVFAEPTPEALRGTIQTYISQQEKLQGGFGILDKRTGDLRHLGLHRVHERVGKTGNYYYSCTDMKDKKTGDLLDLDFDIEDLNGTLHVVDVRIHKDNGNPRYTYDQNDNMIPV